MSWAVSLMKKKTVITTEKHEVWVVREAIPEPAKDQTIDITDEIQVPSPQRDSQRSEGLERSENDDQ
jgi:hypothetical protein